MIRNANYGDLPKLLEMGERFFEASGFDEITTFDRESTETTFMNLIKTGVLLVGEVNGLVVGMVGAIFYPLYFNQSHITGQELFWWVDEEHRKSGIGQKLLSELEEKAKLKGATSFSMVALERLNPDLMKRVYKMQGYFPAEHSFYKRLH